jgi:hypothetical protein
MTRKEDDSWCGEEAKHILDKIRMYLCLFSLIREEDSIPLADDDPSALLDESVTDFLHEDLKKVSHYFKTEDSIPLPDNDPSALLDESVTDFLHEDLKKVSQIRRTSFLWLLMNL